MSGREQTNNEQDIDYILIKKFLGNDEKAFNALVLRYKDRIFNLCFRILGTDEEANDCAQECFIKVFRNLKTFKFESNFSTWLYRIAVNTCKNELGSLGHRMRRISLSLDDPVDPGSDSVHIEAAAPDSYDPSDVYEKKEKQEKIQKAVESLKKKERILIILRDIEGKSYEEIREITGINIGTVKSKLSRARLELRDKLRGII